MCMRKMHCVYIGELFSMCECKHRIIFIYEYYPQYVYANIALCLYTSIILMYVYEHPIVFIYENYPQCVHASIALFLFTKTNLSVCIHGHPEIHRPYSSGDNPHIS